MIKPIRPPEENLRIETLDEYKILDTLSEREFDDLTQIASHICQTPVALITLVGKDRQWHKSKIGIGIQEIPRDLAFCSHTILSDETMIVSDFTKDVRFHDHPLVKDGPCARFYAGAPLITPNGMRIGALCVLDFASREMTPEQVKTLESLARQVVVLLEMRLSVARLEESRLAAIEATAEAQRALKVKTEFLANISHEIRTPMNGIIGMTQIMLDGNSSPENRGRLEIIRDCGRTLLSLINDILDFSKLESGSVEFEAQPFDLISAARGTVELFRPLAQQKNLEIRLTVDETIPHWYVGDVTRVSQVLTNLLSNAIKFTSQGHIDVMIDSLVESLSSGHHLVHISVKDSGIGIPNDLQNRLFRSFSQVDASITRRFGGTGLGLAICRSLCENMGGRIWVTSEVGKGSNFEFTFFAAETSKPAIVSPAVAAPVEEKPTAPIRILLVEDNTINQVVALAFLKKLGQAAEVANNGLEALEKLQEKRFDLVLMDCHMPKMDGFECMRQIAKRWPKDDRPKVVAMTASARKEDEALCREAGMEGFVTKPIDMKSLRALVEEVQVKVAEKATYGRVS